MEIEEKINQLQKMLQFSNRRIERLESALGIGFDPKLTDVEAPNRKAGVGK